MCLVRFVVLPCFDLGLTVPMQILSSWSWAALVV